MKILTIFGTRPEAIKMAPVVKCMDSNPQIESLVCVTAQHREMLDQVLNLFDITPDIDLNLMLPGQKLSGLSSRMLDGLNPVFEQFKPDLVLVHGDTTTTFIASLCAYYNRVPIGHVEAGLRTGDLYSPWPEEGNRKLTGALADLHFAPTVISKQNLQSEGIDPSKITITGNTVIDSLMLINDRLEKDPQLSIDLSQGLPFVINQNRKIVLITGHRRENFGDGFLRICNSILHLSSQYPEVDFVYPVHLNPNVKQPVTKLLDGKENIFLMEPLEYLPFVNLMSKSHIILTDSGGIQEEAPSLGKPVIVMRETTERPEAVSAGTVKLVGTDEQKIIETVSELLNNKTTYNKMSLAHNPYGDGKASNRIVQKIVAEFIGRSDIDA